MCKCSVKLEYPLHVLSTLFFLRQNLSSNLELIDSTRLARLASSRDCVSAFPSVETVSVYCTTAPGFFIWVLGNQTQVLMHAGKAFYQISHFPSCYLCLLVTESFLISYLKMIFFNTIQYKPAS